jgi:hypothetical protein
VRKLKDDVPQGSVLAPMLFNFYIHDLSDTQSRKYGYAYDLAILLSKPSWEAVEEGLSGDMNTLSSYLKNWRSYSPLCIPYYKQYCYCWFDFNYIT